MEKSFIQSLKIQIAVAYAVILLYIILLLFPLDLSNRLGICIITVFISELLIMLYNWNTILRHFDLRISTSTIKVLFWVAIAILSWFIISLGIILSFNIPTVDEDMAPMGFTYMLITDPGTILDSFRDKDTPQFLMPFLCLISIIGFILVCGMMISVCSNIIQRRVDDYKNGIIRYKHLKDHIVMIGFDEIMPSLVRQKCEEYKKSNNKILILSKKNSRQVREHINSMIKKEDQERIVVYCGRRDSMEELEKLDIKEAKEVYILGNRENEGHDALNIDCLSKMRKIIGKRQERESKISITVMFDNYATFAAFQSSDLSKKWRDSFKFKPFNFYEYWAQKIIIDHSYNETDEDETDKEYQNKYPRIEGEEPLKDTNDIVNIIIFGITSMGVAIATQAAHFLHFSRKEDKTLRKSRITFICKNARKEMNMFYSLYSSFFEIQSSYFRDFIDGDGEEKIIPPTYFTGNDANFLDIEFEFINGESYHPGVRDYLRELALDQHRRISIFVSTGNDRRDINIGMSLPEELYYKEKKRITPIFVHQKKSGELLSLLSTMSNDKYKSVYPFGMIDTRLVFTPKNLLRAQLLNQSYLPDSGGLDVDNVIKVAQTNWDVQNPALQWSSIYCANSNELKLREFKLTKIKDPEESKTRIKENLEELCRIEQNRWNVEKLLMGFRKPHQEEQDIINNDRKKNCGNKMCDAYKRKYIHDLIRPYDQLASVKWTITKDDKKIEKDASRTNQEMILSIPIIEDIIEGKRP